MSKFLKISEKQYFTDDMDKLINYEDIKLPRRATTGSAGYDIYSPCDFTIAQGETFKFPTGIRINRLIHWEVDKIHTPRAESPLRNSRKNRSVPYMIA